MIHSILLVVPKPDVYDHKTEQKWRACVETLSGIASNNTDVQLLAENVLLISLHQTLDFLSEVVPALSNFGYKYVIFDEELGWHVVPKKD